MAGVDLLVGVHIFLTMEKPPPSWVDTHIADLNKIVLRRRRLAGTRLLGGVCWYCKDVPNPNGELVCDHWPQHHTWGTR